MSSSASWLPSFLDPTTASEVLAYTTAAAATQMGQLTKTRQKIRLKKLGKFTDHAYACTNFTKF